MKFKVFFHSMVVEHINRYASLQRNLGNVYLKDSMRILLIQICGFFQFFTIVYIHFFCFLNCSKFKFSLFPFYLNASSTQLNRV